MGCCQAKTDQNSNLDYVNEEDEIPRFDIQPVVKGGLKTNDNDNNIFGPNEELKSKEIDKNTKKYYVNNQEQERQIGEAGVRLEDLNNPMHNGANRIRDLQEFNKLLILTIRETKFNVVGTRLEITPKGLKNSTRNANDGIVYFGLHAPDFKNDFCFRAEEGVNKQHFEIKFDEDKPGYYVKNIKGSGVFIKITDYLNLKDGIIISFGTNHLLVSININESQKDYESVISFKSIYGPNKGEKYEFNSTDNPIIRFGRKKSKEQTIDVVFAEESTSRLQCTITYDSRFKIWKITDSDGQKFSLNGTWFLADDFILIEDGMLIRVGTTTFESALNNLF